MAQLKLKAWGLGLVALVTAGCEMSGLGGSAPATVTLQQTAGGSGSAAFQQVAGWFASVAGSEATIDVADVDSVLATVTRVEFLPKASEDDEDNDAAWQSLDVVGNGRIDLVNLPTESEDGIVIASGDVAAGDYWNVRFFLEDVTIWFNRQIQLGQAFTYQPDTEYGVMVPSGDQTGLKTDAEFSIPEGGGEVSIVFDASASLANVTGTGTGMVILAPVLRKGGS